MKHIINYFENKKDLIDKEKNELDELIEESDSDDNKSLNEAYDPDYKKKEKEKKKKILNHFINEIQNTDKMNISNLNNDLYDKLFNNINDISNKFTNSIDKFSFELNNNINNNNEKICTSINNLNDNFSNLNDYNNEKLEILNKINDNIEKININIGTNKEKEYIDMILQMNKENIEKNEKEIKQVNEKSKNEIIEEFKTRYNEIKEKEEVIKKQKEEIKEKEEIIKKQQEKIKEKEEIIKKQQEKIKEEEEEESEIDSEEDAKMITEMAEQIKAEEAEKLAELKKQQEKKAKEEADKKKAEEEVKLKKQQEKKAEEERQAKLKKEKEEADKKKAEEAKRQAELKKQQEIDKILKPKYEYINSIKIKINEIKNKYGVDDDSYFSRIYDNINLLEHDCEKLKRAFKKNDERPERSERLEKSINDVHSREEKIKKNMNNLMDKIKNEIMYYVNNKQKIEEERKKRKREEAKRQLDRKIDELKRQKEEEERQAELKKQQEEEERQAELKKQQEEKEKQAELKKQEINIINDKCNELNNKIDRLYEYDTLLNEYADNILSQKEIHGFIVSNFYETNNKLRADMIDNIKNNFDNENNNNKFNNLSETVDEIINYNYKIYPYYKELKKIKKYMETNRSIYNNDIYDNTIDKINTLLKLLYKSNYTYFVNGNDKESRDGIFEIFLNDYNNLVKKDYYYLGKIVDNKDDDDDISDIEMNDPEDLSMFKKEDKEDKYDIFEGTLTRRKNKINELIKERRNKQSNEKKETDYLNPKERSDVDLLLRNYPNFKEDIIDKVRFKDELKNINEKNLNEFIDKSIVIAYENTQNENDIFNFVLYQLENEILRENKKKYIYGYIVDLTKDYIDFVLNRDMPIENKLYLLTYLKKEEADIIKYIKTHSTNYKKGDNINMIDDAIKFVESNDLKDEIFNNDNFYNNLRKEYEIMYDEYKTIRNQYKKEIEDILFDPDKRTKLTKDDKLKDIKNIFIRSINIKNIGKKYGKK